SLFKRLSRQADGSFGTGEDWRGEITRAHRAFRQNSIQLAWVLAKIVEPAADRSDQRDQRVRKRRFECTKALAGELTKHLIDISIRYGSIDADEVLCLRPALELGGVNR